MDGTEWWAEPFDYAALKRNGFTYREVRELEHIREQAIPADVKAEARAAIYQLIDSLLRPLEDLLQDEDEEQ